MESLQKAFCRKFSCPPEEFERKAFAAVVYPHVRIFLLLGGYRSDYFGPDRAVVSYCGRLCSRVELDRELGEFAQMPENRKFLRSVLRLRVSGRRIKRLAARCWASNN